MKAERDQKALYDRIAADYEAHYDDEASQRFRDTFIYPFLLGNIDFRGTRVLEAVCDYGVVDKGGSKFQLFYNSKCVPPGAIGTVKPLELTYALMPAARCACGSGGYQSPGMQRSPE